MAVARRGDDFIGMRGKNLPLGSGHIIFGQLGDQLEEPRAFVIVEKPWAQRLWPGRKSAQHLSPNTSLRSFTKRWECCQCLHNRRRESLPNALNPYWPAGCRKTASASQPRKNCDSWRGYGSPASLSILPAKPSDCS